MNQEIVELWVLRIEGLVYEVHVRKLFTRLQMFGFPEFTGINAHFLELHHVSCQCSCFI